MPNPDKTHVEDLKLLMAVSLITVIFALVPYLNQTPLRSLFALIFTFFIPGYAFIAAFFPGKNEISGTERVTLSIGFSILITVFTGFSITLLRLELGQESIIPFITFSTLALLLLAYISRRRLPVEKQFHFSYRTFIDSIHAEQTGSFEPHNPKLFENDSQQPKERKFKNINRSKISAIQTTPEDKLKQYVANISSNAFPILSRALIIALVVSIMITGAIFVHAKVTGDKERTTALYILGPEGKAENYPSVLSMTKPTRIIVGIENHEHEPLNYTLLIKLDEKILNQTDIFLEDNEKWEHVVSITPLRLKLGEQKLDFILSKENQKSSYRSVHLWVTQELESEGLSEAMVKVIDFIDLKNPSMENNDGWTFVSTNEENVEGSYKNGSGIYSSRGYMIKSTYEGMTDGVDARHSIQQKIQSTKRENVLLSLYLKDTYTEGTSGKDETQSKQVALNGDVIWSDGVNGNEGWQHLQIPATILNGTNTLTITLKQNGNKEIHPVEFFIDEISFLPLSEISPYHEENNTVEFILPTSKVLSLPASTGEENFTVQWKGSDNESGILYYNIDYSTDGKNWKRWLSKTMETSSEFEGKEGLTYYFRSKAVDAALNQEPDHTVADTYTYVDTAAPMISLDITPNPTDEYAYLTVESSKPLRELTCVITPQSFETSEYVKMTSKNDIVWKGTYTVEVNDDFYVEISGKDYAGNAAYTFGTIYTSTSLERLYFDFNPEKVTEDEVTIKITPSVALENEPTLTVKDKKGRSLSVSYEGFSGGEYIYIAELDDDTVDGTAHAIATATTVDSENLYEEETFTIDRE